MTAYPMGPGDRDDEDLRRSENEGYGHEAEQPFETRDGHEDAPYGTEETPQDDRVVASGDSLTGGDSLTDEDRLAEEQLADESLTDESLADEPVLAEPVTAETDETPFDETRFDETPAETPVVPVPDDRPRASDEGNGSLLEDGFGDRFQQRWHEVQSGFVDDPYETVRQAEQLTDEVVTSLTTALTERKRELDDRWSNEKDNTEELRQSLRGYRALLDRLTAL
jgi:hypothetical protein